MNYKDIPVGFSPSPRVRRVVATCASAPFAVENSKRRRGGREREERKEEGRRGGGKVKKKEDRGTGKYFLLE
jgi:hypothetical protein